MKDLLLVVVDYHTPHLINEFVDSLIKHQQDCSIRLVVVTNEWTGTEGYQFTTRSLEEDYGIETRAVKCVENVGYSGAANRAIEYYGGDCRNFAIFNSDTRLFAPGTTGTGSDRCLDICVDYLDEHDDVAVVGPLQLDRTGRVTHGGILGTLDKPEHRGWRATAPGEQLRDIQEAVTVSGSAYFMKASVWDEMEKCLVYKEIFPDAEGAWPPFPHFFEETLYSYHVQGHGYKCVYLGTAEMEHQWHQSSPVGSQDENFKIGQEGFRKFCSAHGIDHD